jgi:hypothetical protein
LPEFAWFSEKRCTPHTKFALSHRFPSHGLNGSVHSAKSIT